MSENQKSMIMEQITNKITQFLKENGGDEKGYQTFIKGNIKIIGEAKYINMDWHTPKKKLLTSEEINRITEQLYNDLIEILLANYLKGIIINARSSLNEKNYYLVIQTIAEISELHLD